MSDAFEKREPIESKSLDNGLKQKRADFKNLLADEGFLIFSVEKNADAQKQEVKTLARGGNDAKLQLLIDPKSRSLGEFLMSCDDENALLRWQHDQQSWVKLSGTMVHGPADPIADFVVLGQCHKQGDVIFGLFISIRLSQTNDARITSLQSAGLGMLSVYAGEPKNDGSEAQQSSILTAGERRVLLWCGNGKTSFEISRILGLSEHTVNHYIASAVRKLDATNRTHAIAKALKMKIVDPADIN